MIEKVNPSHPDKVADRIAGAIVDLAYSKHERPNIAIEVLIGHGKCNIIIESSIDFEKENNLKEIEKIVNRITKEPMTIEVISVKQDEELAKNQSEEIRCGDNGIFKGVPLTDNEKLIGSVARNIYDKYNSDGKYILTDNKFICCQSNAKNEELIEWLSKRLISRKIIVNPLGEWTGGINVDTGATNRKLGSDMAQSLTGGGLHGKDLSKADVSVNIYVFLKAQKENKVIELNCAIGDDTIDGKPYSEIVQIAKEYIDNIGGFEKFAEWGLF